MTLSRGSRRPGRGRSFPSVRGSCASSSPGRRGRALAGCRASRSDACRRPGRHVEDSGGGAAKVVRCDVAEVPPLGAVGDDVVEGTVAGGVMPVDATLAAVPGCPKTWRQISGIVGRWVRHMRRGSGRARPSARYRAVACRGALPLPVHVMVGGMAEVVDAEARDLGDDASPARPRRMMISSRRPTIGSVLAAPTS